MLNLTSIASADRPTLDGLAERIARLVAHYPSEQAELTQLLLEFAAEIRRKSATP